MRFHKIFSNSFREKIQVLTFLDRENPKESHILTFLLGGEAQRFSPSRGVVGRGGPWGGPWGTLGGTAIYFTLLQESPGIPSAG